MLPRLVSHLAFLVAVIAVAVGLITLPAGVSQSLDTLGIAAGWIVKGWTFLATDSRWLFAIAGLVGTYYIWRTIKLRNVPLRTIKTVVRLEPNPDWSHVHAHRKQWVVANHPNVEAYYTAITASFGTIPNCDLSMSIIHNGKQLGTMDDALLLGGETKGWRVIQRVSANGNSFPYNPITHLIPDFVLAMCADHGWWENLMFTRTLDSSLMNEYNHERPDYTLNALNYSHVNLTIRIECTKETCPQEVKGYITSVNGADEVIFSREGNDFVYRLKRLPRNTGFIVAWSWRPSDRAASDTQVAG